MHDADWKRVNLGKGKRGDVGLKKRVKAFESVIRNERGVVMLRFKKMEISWAYEKYLKTVEFRICRFATASSTQTVCHNWQVALKH